uniref:Uncharacterized protein n=1 Tax=Candidatus Kentrum sp. DK TaxID=2126562 RepID=A0A450S1Y0_9GAMM|nr:MAG: hypothetical protein BECKDK2373C_GA0170839_10121 [Candidatus Kentron sp. DK]
MLATQENKLRSGLTCLIGFREFAFLWQYNEFQILFEFDLVSRRVESLVETDSTQCGETFLGFQDYGYGNLIVRSLFHYLMV